MRNEVIALEYKTGRDAAKEWGYAPDYVGVLLRAGKVPGAVKSGAGGMPWLIPEWVRRGDLGDSAVVAPWNVISATPLPEAKFVNSLLGINSTDLKGLLLRGLTALRSRHRYVLIRRYGLDGFTAASLAELSQIMGVSRLRVLNLQREAERSVRKVVGRELRTLLCQGGAG